MVNIGNTPWQPDGAQRVIALVLLASVSACSHAGESRPSFASDEQQLSTRAAASAHKAASRSATDRSKHGLIRTAEAAPELEAPRQKPLVTPSQDLTTPPVTTLSLPTANPSITGAPREADKDLSNPATEEVTPPSHETIRAVAGPSTSTSAGRAHLPAPVHSAQDREEPSSWSLKGGIGIAALAILGAALLGRRDRKASPAKQDAGLARAEEQELGTAAARAEAQRLEQERSAQAAAEEVAEQERAHAAAREEAQRLERERAEEAAAAEAAEQERAHAAAAAAHAQAQTKADPRVEAAHRLFDLLHRAERDVEPFLRLLDETAQHDPTTSASREVVTSWHESMLSSRNRLAEALARHNAPVDMNVVEPAPNLAGAMSRLIDHAARMSALMVTQQQENSAILHWSRQLPGALIQLFWRAQTARYTSTLPQLPKVPDTLAPGTVAPTAPVAAARPARVQDKAIQQALRGGRSHALRT